MEKSMWFFIVSQVIDAIFQGVSASIRAIYKPKLTKLKNQLAEYASKNSAFAEKLQQAVSNKDNHLATALVYSSPFGGQIQAVNNQAQDYQNKHSEAKQAETEANTKSQQAQNRINEADEHLGETFNYFIRGKHKDAKEATEQAGEASKKYGTAVYNFVNGSANAGYRATANRLENRSIPSTAANLTNGAAKLKL